MLDINAASNATAVTQFSNIFIGNILFFVIVTIIIILLNITNFFIDYYEL